MSEITTTPVERVAVLVNPAAGKGGALLVADQAVRRFRERGAEASVLAGATAADSRELARKAIDDPDIDALVVCGGDGLISLAVQEQAFSDTPLGVVPAGTGNDLARDYGLPIGSPEQAVDVILRGRRERVDLGKITTDEGVESIFASIMCSGVDSAINKKVNELPWPRGTLRYVIASALTFPTYRPRRFRLVLDGLEIVEPQLLLSAVAITGSYGGSMHIAPGADRADGLFDVCYVAGVSKMRAAWSLRGVYQGRHIGEPGVVTRRCRTIRLEAEGVEAYADGDPVGALPVTAEVLPGAGLMLVP